MRTPPGYEEMIHEIAKVARKYGFSYRKDTLEDEPNVEVEDEHYCESIIQLQRHGKILKVESV